MHTWNLVAPATRRAAALSRASNRGTSDVDLDDRRGGCSGHWPVLPVRHRSTATDPPANDTNDRPAPSAQAGHR